MKQLEASRTWVVYEAVPLAFAQSLFGLELC